MGKKIMIGTVFFMLMSASIYSQVVQTAEFGLIQGISQDISREVFIETGLIFGYKSEGFEPIKRLPNSVINEIDRQLIDYRPLNNGQVFYWRGGLIQSTVSAQVYMVLLRVTDARNSQWEYYAFEKFVSTYR